MSELEPTRTYSNPTATETLRRLLDERGVEWEKGLPTETIVREPIDTLYVERPDGMMHVYFRSYLTPEQAIDATLGRGTCQVDVLNTGDCAGYECSEYIMHCNACGHEFGHVLYNEDGDVWMSEPPNYCPNCGRRVVE